MKSKIRLSSLFLLAALIASCPVAFAQKAPRFEPLGPPQALFEKGTDGYFIYKIPTLVSTKGNKHALAIVEGRIGSAADSATTHILCRRSSDNGLTWSKPVLIVSDGAKTVGNPSAVLDETTGVIWLFFCKQNYEVWVVSSKDDGLTWSPPEDLTATLRSEKYTKFYATGPGHGIQLKHEKHKGRLVVPAYASMTEHGGRPAGSKSFAIYSDDHGKTWKAGESTEAQQKPGWPDGNECMITELGDGRLYMTIRNNMVAATGGRGYALSEDGGRTWGEVQIDKTLPEPVNQASVLAYPLKDGGIAQLYIAPSLEAKSRKDKSARRNLAIWASMDDCRSWKRVATVQTGPSAYSDAVIFEDGSIGIFYEGGSNRFDDKLLLRRYRVKQ